MTDAAVGDMPIEPVPPIPPPGPESTAEVEAASPEAAPAEAPADRAAPFDVEHLGPLRRAVLDALLDTEEPQSVAQILAAMPPGTSRGSGESAIKREFDAGRIMRTSPGHYALAPARPPGAKPAAPPEPDKSEDEWVAAIELWVIDPESWSREALGPRPKARRAWPQNSVGHRCESCRPQQKTRGAAPGPRCRRGSTGRSRCDVAQPVDRCHRRQPDPRSRHRGRRTDQTCAPSRSDRPHSVLDPEQNRPEDVPEERTRLVMGRAAIT
jgi:hypothetical protein